MFGPFDIHKFEFVNFSRKKYNENYKKINQNLKYFENTLKNLFFWSAVWDDFWKCSIIRAKRGVFKVIGMVSRCSEDANNFPKNASIFCSKSPIITIFTEFAPQNKHFGIKMVILTPKMVEN